MKKSEKKIAFLHRVSRYFKTFGLREDWYRRIVVNSERHRRLLRTRLLGIENEFKFRNLLDAFNSSSLRRSGGHSDIPLPADTVLDLHEDNANVNAGIFETEHDKEHFYAAMRQWSTSASSPSRTWKWHRLPDTYCWNVFRICKKSGKKIAFFERNTLCIRI